MTYEWLITDIKYSMLRHLWVKPFASWTFSISGPDIPEEGIPVSQFYLWYPVGSIQRPSIGIEYGGATPRSKTGVLGVCNEAATFTLHLLGDADKVGETEKMLQMVKGALHDVKIPGYGWNPTTKKFDRTLGNDFVPRWSGDQMRSIRQLRDKPEASATFVVEY